MSSIGKRNPVNSSFMLISMSEKPTHLSLNGKMGEDEMVMIYK
jgi:hypothetical protein